MIKETYSLVKPLYINAVLSYTSFYKEKYGAISPKK